MVDVRFPSKKRTGQSICLFVLLCGIYGLYPSLKKLSASNWIQLITGLSSSATALLVAGVGYKNYQELQRKNARDAETAAQNYQALVDKDTADRFSKAIDQLGDKDSIHIRLGGIFALEQIANTEDKYYWQIMEVLTAYVRERSPWPEKEDKKRQVDPETGKVLKLGEDIQAVMTVLARRKNQPTLGNVLVLDLRETDLRNLYLLPNSNLNHVDLKNSNLSGATLEGVNFERSRFDKALIQNAKLQGANLKNAQLWQTSLKNAILVGADLAGASLTAADLTDAQFLSANLKETILSDTTLDNADMRLVDLERARFSNTSVQGTCFFEAKNLSREQKSNTKLTENAVWPDYLN